MTTTIAPDATTTTPVDSVPVAARPRWPLFGVAAGVLAIAGTVAGMPSDLEESDYTVGVEVIDKLDPANYRVSFLLGLVSIGCLFVASSAFRRWDCETPSKTESHPRRQATARWELRGMRSAPRCRRRRWCRGRRRGTAER